MIMSTFGIYLLQSTLCLTVFYALYALAFRKQTFFGINRIYLISGLLLSFIIPQIKIPLLSGELQTLTYSIENTLDGWPTYPTISSTPSQANGPLTSESLFIWIYLAGVIIVLSRAVLSIFRILHLREKSEIIKWNGLTLVVSTGTQPFSFFQLIFIPDGAIDPMVLQHEKIHVVQYHWIDLILVELATIMLWFNPIIYLYKQAMKIQHEYFADSQVIRNNRPEHYLTCLLQQIQFQNAYGPISQFYSSTIKKRIIMISKNKSPFHSAALYLLVIPFTCLLLFAFSGKQEQTSATENLILDEPGSLPFIAPVNMKVAKIASGYGNRMHPYFKKIAFHLGIDFRLAEGEIVMASANGAVTVSTYDSLNGNYILIRHDEVYSSKYTHLKSTSVKAGDPVNQGQTIGYVGSTGISTAPHLHYELFKDGVNVDPAGYLPK